jgi:hypothetical protein
VSWCWNGKNGIVTDEEREREEPAVLPARKAMSLLGEAPAESDSSDEEAVEPTADAVRDPERRSA